ncbi:hypothetical protein BV22DRAFT_1032812 [Leucogyrophana mollusca]|uniref:Uncharacterized protein n=1 Tax=Leucogyrophana mollusca TaxID=85980 RepID=A0ACB8BKY6_9AGAM|nr:hypothetical protein BV22DRAFT_1032812 [Leucogyrophana mollusca]
MEYQQGSRTPCTGRNADIQHRRPIKSAKRTTEVVYCPSALYEGCVRCRYRHANNEHKRPMAYTPQVSVMLTSDSLTSASIPRSLNMFHVSRAAEMHGFPYNALPLSARERTPHLPISIYAYLLKYLTMFSMSPGNAPRLHRAAHGQDW